MKLKKKNILILSNCTWYIYNFRTDLINKLYKLKKEEYDLILVSPFDKYQKYLIPSFKKTENLFLIRGSENPFVEFLSIIHIFFYYIKYRPSIVHHFTLKPSLYGSIVARLLGIKKILNHITGLGPSLCSSREKIKFINKLIKPIYKYAFKNSINIFHNEDDRDIFIKRDFTTLNKSHVIKGSGVNVRYFANNKATKSIKKDIQILFPGRIIREKGIIELIEVCEKLWIEGYKFTLLIAGQIDKHNSSTLDKKTLDSISMNKNIKLLGHIRNMKKIYINSDIVVLPSWREGLSRSLLESGAMALPIITTNVPGCKDIIENNYSGILVPPKDLKRLKRAIKLFLENKQKAKQFGLNARKSVAKDFNLDKINFEILEIYKIILD